MVAGVGCCRRVAHQKLAPFLLALPGFVFLDSLDRLAPQLVGGVGELEREGERQHLEVDPVVAGAEQGITVLCDVVDALSIDGIFGV